MIAKLNKRGFESFTTYFKSTAESDPELWAKIKPRMHGSGRSASAYVVKTFRTMWKKDENGFSIEVPVDMDSLKDAYKLVKATPSIDVWSFGAIPHTACFDQMWTLFSD